LLEPELFHVVLVDTTTSSLIIEIAWVLLVAIFTLVLVVLTLAPGMISVLEILRVVCVTVAKELGRHHVLPSEVILIVDVLMCRENHLLLQFKLLLLQG
jgi:hypothetical protein